MDILLWLLGICIALRYYYAIFGEEDDNNDSKVSKNRGVTKETVPSRSSEDEDSAEDRRMTSNVTKTQVLTTKEEDVSHAKQRSDSIGISDNGISPREQVTESQEGETHEDRVCQSLSPRSTTRVRQTSSQPSTIQTGESWVETVREGHSANRPPLAVGCGDFISPFYEYRYLTFVRDIAERSRFTNQVFMDDHRKRLVVKKVVLTSILSEGQFYRKAGLMDRVSGADHFLKICGRYKVENTAGVLFTEYFNGCHLDSLFKNDLITPSRLRTILQQILQAVSYMRRRCIIHCDIRGENILVDEQNKLKITGFGQCMSNMESGERFGTLGYEAPEVLAQLLRKNPERPSYPCDIYSVGATIFVNIFRRFPGYSSTYVLDRVVDRELYVAFLNSAEIPVEEKGVSFPPGFDELLEDLLRRLLEPNVKLRYTADAALSHPYFAQNTEQLSIAFPTPLAPTYHPQQEEEVTLELEPAVVVEVDPDELAGGKGSVEQAEQEEQDGAEATAESSAEEVQVEDALTLVEEEQEANRTITVSDVAEDQAKEEKQSTTPTSVVGSTEEHSYPQEEESPESNQDGATDVPQEEEKKPRKKKSRWQRFKEQFRCCKTKKSGGDEEDLNSTQQHSAEKKETAESERVQDPVQPQSGKKKGRVRRIISRIFHPPKKDKRKREQQ